MKRSGKLSMDDLLEIAQMRGLRTATEARDAEAAPEAEPGAVGAGASSDGPPSSDIVAAEAEPAAPHDEGSVAETLDDEALALSAAAAAASPP
jgi:hypothetical protein